MCLLLYIFLSSEISRIKDSGDSSLKFGEVEIKYEDDALHNNNGKPSSPMLGSEPPLSSQHHDGQSKLPDSKKFRRPGEYVTEDVIKLHEKVIVPVKEFPKVWALECTLIYGSSFVLLTSNPQCYMQL